VRQNLNASEAHLEPEVEGAEEDEAVEHPVVEAVEVLEIEVDEVVLEAEAEASQGAVAVVLAVDSAVEEEEEAEDLVAEEEVAVSVVDSGAEAEEHVMVQKWSFGSLYCTVLPPETCFGRF